MTPTDWSEQLHKCAQRIEADFDDDTLIVSVSIDFSHTAQRVCIVVHLTNDSFARLFAGRTVEAYGGHEGNRDYPCGKSGVGINVDSSMRCFAGINHYVKPGDYAMPKRES